MQTTSKKVYLSPDVFFAYIDRTHAKHTQASAFFRYFAQNQYHLYIDTISLYETYKQIINQMSPSIAKEFLRTLYISNISVLYPEESDFKTALKVLLNDKTNELTFQVALMTVIADKKGISQICTVEYIHTMFGLSIFYLPL